MKWIEQASEPLTFQQNQMDFLDAHKRRYCKQCKKEYQSPPHIKCPLCGEKGIRVFEFLTMIAGRRFGKTRFGSIAAAEEASIPNTVGWACAPTNPKLHRYVIPAFQKIIPSEWVRDYNSEFQDLRLKNGSLIHFQTLEDPDQGRGQGLDWLWIDEVCELTKDHWDVIRPSLGDRQGVAFFTTSPRSFDWVYEEFYQPAEHQTPGYWVLHAKSSESPVFQTPEGSAFLQREKLRMSDTMYRQEYEADFVVYTGSVYGSALDTQILRTEDDIRKIIPEWNHGEYDRWRQVLVGIDTGADHPFGAVKIVSSEAGLVVIGEYLERHRSFIEHAQSIKRLAGSKTAKYAINRNERQGMIELAQHGIICSGAENDVVAGVERVKSWLHAKQLFFYEPGCPRTVKEMKSYRWADDKTKAGEVRKERVFKKDDELPDCLRYALQTWPQLPKPRKEDSMRKIDNLPEEMQATIRRNRRLEEPKKLDDFDVVGDFYA